jgi:cytochrome b561/polyisoprenoid-binding protein YceI
VTSEPERVGSGRYATVAILLHWLIAAAIVLQIALGLRMGSGDTPEAFAVFQLHKSVGITILLLSLVRLGWRLSHPPPPLPATLAPWERTLARITHIAFYAIMIGMPLTGWLIVSTSRIAVPTLLYGVIPWPHLPGVAQLAPEARKAWFGAGVQAHELLAWSLIGLLALHVAGALKHQLFSRDEPVLARMAPGAKDGRWLEPRLLVILLGFVGVAAFGALVQPPRPASAPPPVVLVAAEPVAEPAVAQAPAEPATPTPVVAAAPSNEPVRWRVAPGSTLGFTTAWSGQAVQGRFDRWRADILFGPEALDRSSVTVTIDVGSAKTGDAQRDEVLPSGDWFDAAAHPQAVFAAKRFEKTGTDHYVAHGTLELRGVKRPLDLPFKLTIAGDQATVSGAASLDRTAFGVGQGEFAATDQIPGKVAVRVQLTARRD